MLYHPKYRSDVDGLRAIAVLCVVGYHALPSVFKGGFIGVDVFFVISGYLISLIIIENIKNDSFRVLDFYSRRIRRIFPALLLVLIFCFSLGWVTLSNSDYMLLGKHIAAGATFVSNIILWSESGYFDMAADTKPLLHLWSLGIEEQFYILWPVILNFVWRHRMSVVKVTLFLLVLSFALNIWMMGQDSSGDFYSPQTRAWELLVGAMLANSESRDKLKIHFDWLGNSNTRSVLGFAAIVFSIASISKASAFPGWWALLPTLGTALVISSGNSAWLNRTILSNKLLVWFGLISFPLYLWHWPLLVFPKMIIEEPLPLAVKGGAVITAIFLAWVTYFFVEKPLRNNIRSKSKVITLILLMTIVGLIGYDCYRRGGLKFRNDWNKLYISNSECKMKYPLGTYCNVADLKSAPDAVLMGDSHANHFYLGLRDHFNKLNINLLNQGVGGCAPLIGVDRGSTPNFGNLKCYESNKPIFDYILNSKNLKTVVLAFHHNEHFRNDVEFIDLFDEIHGVDNFVNVKNALLRTIKLLELNGKSVIIIYDMPDLKREIKGCFSGSSDFKVEDCRFDESIFVNDFEKYDFLISEIKKNSNAKIYYTQQFMKGNFPISLDGIPMYRDTTHLSIEGSLFFGKVFDSQ